MARVLVVEPEPTISDLLTVCLELDGHRVTTASDITDGVELLEREPVDLILTDLCSRTFAPDAFAKVAALTRVAPATPIVVATAHVRAGSVDPTTYGLAAILVKPFRAHELRALVERTLAERRRK
jgi:DNA-binding NtrC family response regulator